MVTTVKFSQFENAGTLVGGQKVVGLDLGLNSQYNVPPQFVLPFTNATQPAFPMNGDIGYNTDISLFQYWNGVAWVNIAAASSSGTVNFGAHNSLAFYSVDGTAVTGLGSANNGVLVTSALGVPSISSTLPLAAQLNITELGVITAGTWNATPIVGTYIATNTIANSNLAQMPTLTIKGNATGVLGAAADLTASQALTLLGVTANGTAAIGQLPGTATNDNAADGNVGEFITSVVLSGSAITLTNSVIANLTNITLDSGDWDLWGNGFISNGGNNITAASVWINSVSITKPDNSIISEVNPSSGSTFGLAIAMTRISISVPTIFYISGAVAFSAGSTTMCGFISARRAR